MKIKIKLLYLIIIIVMAFGSGAIVEYQYEMLEKKPPPPITEVRSDTVHITTTIIDTLLMPVNNYVHRIDTVQLKAPGDTVFVPVLVPIERKTYKTDDYKAVVEGWNPSLVEMEIYKKFEYITNTETIYETKYVKTKPRWGVGIQVGAGYNGQTFSPYFGVGLQYNFLSF